MSNLALVHGDGEVLDLATMEVLTLTNASLDELAEARDALGELYHARNEATHLVDAELVRRADNALASGEDFGATGRYTISVDRGGAAIYDSNALRADLLGRASRGELPITVSAVERAFSVTQYRLDLHAWRNLCKRWPELTEIGERHVTPKRRSAHVKRRNVIEGEVAA